jgi:transposase-like protein
MDWKETGMTSGTKIRDEVLAELLAGYEKPDDLLGEGGILEQLTKALVERALGAELSHHLGYEKGDGRQRKRENQRNGYSQKRVMTENGALEIEVPRDRAGTFEPQIVPKGERRLSGFDERIIALYARGMTVREIQAFVEEQYGVTVSPDLISTVTDGVLEEVKEWQNRPLEPLYPVVIFDALRVKIRDEGVVRNKAVYLALAMGRDGHKEVLGLWIEQTEGAKFWLRVMNELKNRGVEDILIAVVDGLKGFPEAITAVFPQTQVQTCIVHLLRNSLEFVGWKDYNAVTGALKEVYRAETAQAAEQRLEAFAASEWGQKYPTIAPLWRRQWEHVIPFLAYPQEVRQVIYTTNALESLHMRLRKIIKNRGHFPNDEAAAKLLYLALRNITRAWTMPPRTWKAAMNQFAILFEERMTRSVA